MFGPAVTIATVGHPIHPGLREYMYCDHVTIGDNTVIGAGSVVTKDIPANCVAAGKPLQGHPPHRRVGHEVLLPRPPHHPGGPGGGAPPAGEIITHPLTAVTR